MIQFTTKAETLKALEAAITSARVLPQVCFTVGECTKSRHLPIELLKQSNMLNTPLIVRSSAKNEDTAESSNAGKYLSVANVKDEAEILDAVDKVIAAMGTCEENQVFIQPYLSKVSMCGVVFTMDPNIMGHYYVVNYDETGSTSSVTDGTGSGLKTYYCFKPHRETALVPLDRVLNTCAELEEIFENQALDIEFAIMNDELYILQVRPLVLRGSPLDIEEQGAALSRIHRKLSRASAAQPNILGDYDIYSVMTDWNPAEMIGIRPRQLALSLYKEIITNNVWAYQRSNYGYRNMRSFPLMLDFCGLPYIDVRVSFNSFIPQSLSDELATKLVHYYLDRLRENPSKHDKVEFEVAFTCYTFDLEERLTILSDYGFTESERAEILRALREQTNAILDYDFGHWKSDVKKVEILKEKSKSVMDSAMEPEAKIYWLLEYCKRYGTLPFAGLARAGFIAVEFLKSMVTTGILTEEEKAAYMNSLSTIGKNISRESVELSPASFLKKYGHLRPGTYDIRSERYDQAGVQYFHFAKQQLPPQDEEFRLSIETYSLFQSMLDKHQLKADVLKMFDFIKQAIESREYSKFVFTHTLSDVLELLAELGARFGFDREDMSYVSIQSVLEAYSQANDLEKVLRNSIAQGKESARIASSLTLPPLIWDASQVYSFFLPDGSPNFITQKSCAAPVVLLPSDEELSGKIVLIESADPGYDWIFSRGIAGFITAYGGANSHMAIRAAEFALPAVIGVGEKQFQHYARASCLTLDCRNRTIISQNKAGGRG